jgi:hypothetical protein
LEDDFSSVPDLDTQDDLGISYEILGFFDDEDVDIGHLGCFAV